MRAKLTLLFIGVFLVSCSPTQDCHCAGDPTDTRDMCEREQAYLEQIDGLYDHIENLVNVRDSLEQVIDAYELDRNGD